MVQQPRHFEWLDDGIKWKGTCCFFLALELFASLQFP